MTIEKIDNLLKENHELSQKNGYVGYDPQLFWHLKFYQAYAKKSNIVNKILRRIEFEFLKNVPVLIIPYAKFCKIEKELSPYGLGLFLQVYTNLYTSSLNQKYLEESKKIISILEPLLIELPHGLGAGNPKTKYNEYKPFFNTFATNETSYLVVVAEILFGLINFYHIKNSKKTLILIKKLSTSILYDYKQKTCANDCIMLNYSTVDDETHILNANALALKGLVLAEECTDIKLDKEWIKKIYLYIFPYLKQKQIPYAGEEDKSLSSNYKSADLYHTGFTLRGMLGIAKYLSLEEDIFFIKQRMKEILDEFLLDDKIVMFPSKDLIEVHSVAEYINLYSEIYTFLDNKSAKRYLKIIENNVGKINNKKGSYVYKIEKANVIDIYFPRWSHSVMMNALSKLRNSLRNNEIVV
jgi:hypothetical protein